jgi:hypothetical protein
VPLDPSISIGRVSRIELVGVSDPFQVRVSLDVVELSMSEPLCDVQSGRLTHQFKIEVSGNTKDILDLALFESLDDVLRKFHGHI